MPHESVAHNLWRYVPPEQRPGVDHLITEDDEPLDGVFQEKQQRFLIEPLFSSWKPAEKISPDRSFVAFSNVGLFYDVNQPPLVPDVLLSLGVSLPTNVFPKRHRSYFVWEYGKIPEVSIEVVTNCDGGEDTTKIESYAHVGVPYYIIFDPEQHLGDEVLCGFELQENGYRRMEEPIWLPLVELGLRLWRGEYEKLDALWLRWVDADGRPIPTGAELAERFTSQAQQRAERLAAQLRRLGVEPEYGDG